MIYSINLTVLNRMNPKKMLFGDEQCDICGGDNPSVHLGSLNYCKICYWNRMDNVLPDDSVQDEDEE